MDASGAAVPGTVIWTSSDTMTAVVSSAGVVTAISAGHATITASQGGKTASAAITVNPGTLSIKGVWAQFERVGAQGGFWNGELLKRWDSVDATMGVKISDAVSAQMDAMRAMGVNAVSFQVTATDSTSSGQNSPPQCYVPPILGAQWPQPTQTELTNLVKFFDLAQTKGIKVLLELAHMHMEENPPTNATTWLTALLGAVKAHPALEAVAFMGNTHTDTVGTNIGCGVQAEPPLNAGPTSEVYQHIKFEFGLARSLGVDPRKISAEAVVGSYSVEFAASTAGAGFSPIRMLKQIFDELSWPSAQRLYALSFYQQKKCAPGAPPVCTDIPETAWLDTTARYVSQVVGPASGARVIATEWGTLQNASASTPPVTVSNITSVMRKFGFDGGAYWIWVNTDNTYEASLPFADGVLHRGAALQYNPVKDSLQASYLRP